MIVDENEKLLNQNDGRPKGTKQSKSCDRDKQSKRSRIGSVQLLFKQLKSLISNYAKETGTDPYLELRSRPKPKPSKVRHKLFRHKLTLQSKTATLLFLKHFIKTLCRLLA